MPNRGYSDEKRRSRSRSNSRRYHRHRDVSRSRSRSKSVEERRRRRRSPHNRNKYSSRRYREDSRSYSRSRSRSFSSERTDRHSSTKRKEHYSLPKSRQSGNEDNNVKTSTTACRPSENVSEEMNLANLPLPKQNDAIGSYYNLDGDEPIDKERIHREMEEKLRQTLAKEGKVYPPPKPEASHPVFANDGSFLEIFKKMQEAQKRCIAPSAAVPGLGNAITSTTAASTSTAAAYVAATAYGKSAPPPPMVGRRRGGKILKTGLVAKPKAQTDGGDDPKDFWALYLAEVNKYKNNACESESGNRPLVK